MVTLDKRKLNRVYLGALRIEGDMALERQRLELLHEKRLLENGRDESVASLVRRIMRTNSLEDACFIFDWLNEFRSESEGRRVLSVLGEVPIFKGCYERCPPSNQEGYEVWLHYRPDGLVSYTERYKGLVLIESKRLFCDPTQMAHQLHPYFIMAASESITTGQVWELIQHDIEFQTDIFATREEAGKQSAHDFQRESVRPKG